MGVDETGTLTELKKHRAEIFGDYNLILTFRPGIPMLFGWREGLEMAQKAPGRSDREGITLMQLADLFPDEAAAREWFESRIWPDGRHCPHCGSVRTHEGDGGNGMPYRCSDCRGYFSIKTGTLMHNSRLPLRKWAFAIYLHLTSLKGVSSMKLHRDIGVSQKTAWFMLQRIRKAFEDDDEPPFDGPVEADETYIGGKRKNMPNSKRKALTGRGSVGKTAVVGTKDRASNRVAAKPVPTTDALHVAGFVAAHTKPGAKVYTDEAAAYNALNSRYDHEAVNHSVGEYVRQQAHTNGMESFWAMLKRGYHGVYHYMSAKHLHRYVNEFAGRHNIRDADTIDQMGTVAHAMAGKRLSYADLVA